MWIYYAISRPELQASLNRHALDDRIWSGRRKNSRDAETRGGVERVPLLFGALTASGHQHHRHIEELPGIGSVGRADDAVHHQQLAVGLDGAAAIGEDLPGALIVPVVHDVLHDVSVGARRYCFEEASTEQFAVIAERRQKPVVLRLLSMIEFSGGLSALWIAPRRSIDANGSSS